MQMTSPFGSQVISIVKKDKIKPMKKKSHAPQTTMIVEQSHVAIQCTIQEGISSSKSLQELWQVDKSRIKKSSQIIKLEDYFDKVKLRLDSHTSSINETPIDTSIYDSGKYL